MTRDTFPEWLMQRYPRVFPLDEFGDNSYAQHEAAAIRRAVARNGFKEDEK